jgi:acetolactate synthase-1/2/3 large subunit
VLALIAGAAKPLLIAGPQLANRSGRALLARIEAATKIPTCIMESPRGFNDATLGAFADLAARCDLIVLLGKALDFTLKFGAAPAIDPACRFVMIDPDGTILTRAIHEKPKLLAFGCIADTHPAAEALIRRAAAHPSSNAWLKEARSHFTDRPAAWETLVSQTPDKLHPVEVFRALKPHVERHPDTVLICDGGEFAQWGQSLLTNDRRMINGVGGSIGSSLPMAIGARVVEPAAPVFAILGDGTFGFHMAEFETAVRSNLPFVAVVGTDARWNAEYNLQVRDYGANRAVGCELMATRYDLVVTALGGHGELVRRAEEMPGAIERALASGKPACINVMIESIPAPTVRRTPRPA